ncbi:MAG TPA: BrnT family toxin [Acetobacteraceae bacterium]|nr:BrnT family toxin [Acetobacteraceae bacterium]
MRWVWWEAKNRANRRAHHLSFETARLVFDDPLALSRVDPDPDGDRWQTTGLVGAVCLFVVHTWPEPDPISGEETGRIISARKATAHERRAYEEGAF